MHRELRFTHTADKQLSDIENNHALTGILKQVRKTLGYLETNLRSKSLQTHKHNLLSSRYKREIFEAYVQQNTSGAYRVFWHYGDDEVDKNGKRVSVITVVHIGPHP